MLTSLALFPSRLHVRVFSLLCLFLARAQGGLSSQGWFYESMDDVAFAWGEVNGCSSDSSALTTPYDGGKANVACVERANCLNGARVIRCLYDGGHSKPSAFEGLAWWFMQSTIEASTAAHYAALPVGQR